MNSIPIMAIASFRFIHFCSSEDANNSNRLFVPSKAIPALAFGFDLPILDEAPRNCSESSFRQPKVSLRLREKTA